VKKKLAVRPVFLLTPHCGNVDHTLSSISPGMTPCPPPHSSPITSKAPSRGTPTPISQPPHHRRPLAAAAPPQQHRTSFHDVHSSGLDSPASRNALPSARLDRIDHHVLPSRPPARLRLKQLHAPHLGARASETQRPSSPRAVSSPLPHARMTTRMARGGRGRYTRGTWLQQLRLHRGLSRL
jgi:hypothetical protein